MAYLFVVAHANLCVIKRQSRSYTVLADATIYVESDTQLLGGIWLNDSLKPDTQATLIRLAQYHKQY